jgi:hypothetical protein
MAGNIRETLIAFGKVKQTDLATANVVADMIRVNKLNATVTDLGPVTEDDAQEIGKGSEFAQNHYLTSWNVSSSWDKYLSSEMAAWLFAFGFGKSVASVPTGGTLSHLHTATVQDPSTDGIDMVPFSLVEQVRPGGSAIFDRMYPGCVLEDFTIDVQSGPGRAASKFSANIVGTGALTVPSGITMPSPTTEHLLPSGSLGLTINGVDYVSAKSIIEAHFSFKNNCRLDTGYYPGSGFQVAGDPTSGQIRGRMEFGDRVVNVNFVARFNHGSTEMTTLQNQSEGSLSWTMQGALIEGTIYHALDIEIGRIYFSRVRNANNAGIITAEVEAQVLLPSSGALSSMISAATTNAINKFGAE